MAVSDGTIYEFANFRLDPEDNLLLRNGESIPLSPKAFSTLLLLVERNGHLVRKEELIEKVWANAFVEEAAVSRCVWTIRNALGESSKTQRFIQTVPKLGYKFVAEVAKRRDNVPYEPETNGLVHSGEVLHTGNDAISSPIVVENAKETRSWYQQKPIALTFAVVGLLVLVIVASSFLLSSRSAPAEARTQFAVLPLKPIDAANRSDVYEVGVADSLIHRLNSIKGFVVRPLSATRKYDALDQDPLAAGREQNVDHVIASNYQVADGKFRLTAQLINVASGQVEESYRVEIDAGKLFAIQDGVATEVGNKLVARFGTSAGIVRKRGTSNEEAYQLYLQGKTLRTIRTAENAKKAVEYFNQAIQLDPNFALAYAAKARALANPENDRSGVGYDEIKQNIDRALQLDANLAEAYVARGEFHTYPWDLTSSERDLNKAIELEPNHEDAHWLIAVLLAYRGSFDEALREIEIAQEIYPGALHFMSHRGRILYYARRYDEAIVQYKRAIDMDARILVPHFWLMRAYEMKGDHDSAFEYFIKRERSAGRMSAEQLENYQNAYDTLGWKGARLKWLEDAEAKSINNALFDGARLFAMHGEKDAAFEYLNKAFEKRVWLMPTLKVEPAFDNLRDDPRFDQLLVRVGLR